MKAATAIKKYMGMDGHPTEGALYDNPKMTEIKEFKSVCSDEEWQQMGRDACEIMGEEFEPTESK